MRFDILHSFTDRPVAIDDSGNSLDGAQFGKFCEQFAQLIPPRSLIFIECKNGCEALAGFLACLELRIVPLLIDHKMDSGLKSGLVKTYRPAFIWKPEAKNVESSDVLLSWHEYNLYKTGHETPELHEDLSLLLTTSGSTGSPKLVRHSYRNVYKNAVNVAKAFSITKYDRPLVFLPMQYTMGLSLVCSHLMAGATVHLTDRPITDSVFWKRLKDEQITNITGVPFSFVWFKKLRLERMDLPHLKVLSQGGGKLEDELFKAFADFCAKHNKKFIASYGQTESTARMSVLDPEMALQKAGSIGKAIPEGAFSIRLDDGSISKEGEARGELVYEGPNVTLGYAYSHEDLMNPDERRGVLSTGDIARRDADGFYYIEGRMSRFLKIYGIRISMDEVESLVAGKYETDCAVIGRDDEMRILIAGNKDEKEVRSYVSEVLHLNHAAISVSAVDEIKRNSAGKIMYTEN